jgi:hypothetical protein
VVKILNFDKSINVLYVLVNKLLYILVKTPRNGSIFPPARQVRPPVAVKARSMAKLLSRSAPSALSDSDLSLLRHIISSEK